MPFKINMVHSINKRHRFLSINQLYVFFFKILLFLMIFIPRTGQGIKLTLLIIMLFLIILNIIISKKIIINKQILMFISIFLSYALISAINGIVHNNLGALGFVRVNILYVILLANIIVYIRRDQDYQGLIKTVTIASNAISIYSILLFMVNIGIWPEKLFIYFDVTSNVGLHQGYVQLTNTNLSMLIFIAPFITYLLGANYSTNVISRKYLLFSEILMFIAILISGRRILWIALIIPLIVILFKKTKKLTIKNFAFITILLVSIVIIFKILTSFGFLSLNGIVYRFETAFINGNGNIRIVQAKALWEGFVQNPIIGSGAGIGVDSVIRNIKSPWMYELSYNLILYNAGLIGFTLYLISHIYILILLFKKIRNNDILAGALFLSYVVVLIGNATNPYTTSSFDFLWFIFFPLMYLNIKSQYKSII